MKNVQKKTRIRIWLAFFTGSVLNRPAKDSILKTKKAGSRIATYMPSYWTMDDRPFERTPRSLTSGIPLV